MPVWLTSCERISGQKSGGVYIDGPAFKFCFHTTEGVAHSPAEVRQRAAAHPTPPHFWCNFEQQIAVQVIDLERSAYALRHDTGTPETNKARVIQVEIEGFAAETHLWPAAKLDWITDTIVKPACQAMGIDASKFLECLGQGDGVVLATKTSPIRMNDKDQWYAFNGLFGHQHAPGISGNAHWDPGKLDLEYISRRASM